MIKDTYFFVFDTLGRDDKRKPLNGEFIVEGAITYKIIKDIEEEFKNDNELLEATALSFVNITPERYY